MAVEAIDETGRYPRAPEVAAVLQALLDERGLGEREVTLVLVDDEAIARLNERDRGVEGPTDVLSYPTSEPDDVGYPAVPHLGDVIVSVDTASRQAAAAGHDLDTEVVTLAAHGLTHLLGHDHVTEGEWQPFVAAQERAVALLRAGVGAAEE
ncbi:MAG TPA: rRNA maturation RNase YbeY [Trueperaceae bacterium]|nr:rRNA maturation RNase YbeY [Trueperaceae bacterium]